MKVREAERRAIKLIKLKEWMSEREQGGWGKSKNLRRTIYRDQLNNYRNTLTIKY